MSEPATMTINERLIAAGEEIGTLEKDGYNDFHKYEYVTEAQVKRAVGAALRKFGLSIIKVSHELLPGSTFDKVLCSSTVWVTDGKDTVQSSAIGSGSDKGDKAVFKAMAGGLKYALTSLFLVPTGDDPELDTDKKPTPTAPPVKKAPTAKPPSDPKKASAEPAASFPQSAVASAELVQAFEAKFAGAGDLAELQAMAKPVAEAKTDGKLTDADYAALTKLFKARMAELKEGKK